MEWDADVFIASVSAISAVAAAIAAIFSYKTSKGTLNALLNKEKPLLNLEAVIKTSQADNLKYVHLTLENYGLSYAIFESFKFVYTGTRYDARA
jgi:hypothetical protein